MVLPGNRGVSVVGKRTLRSRVGRSTLRGASGLATTLRDGVAVVSTNSGGGGVAVEGATSSSGGSVVVEGATSSGGGSVAVEGATSSDGGSVAPAFSTSGGVGSVEEEEEKLKKSSCGGCDARKDGNGATREDAVVGDVPTTRSSGRAGDEEERKEEWVTADGVRK